MARPNLRNLALLLLSFAASSVYAQSTQAIDSQWPTYGGDPGGQRYTASTQITRANVTQLQPAWTFHTGSVAKGRTGVKNSSFEATPILFHGLLYLTSPYDEIFAIDPANGEQRWQFDPHLTRNMSSGILTSRGVASWSSTEPAAQPCATRIFLATMDARLVAVDARTGLPCTSFGTNGSIDLTQNVHFRAGDDYFSSSPPTVVGNVVVVGSGIVDNQRVDMESGVVRAFDCTTGRQLWAWDPIPWAEGQKLRTGAANAWSVIAADLEHGLIYVPTGAASPDFYGGLRPGDDRDANSVVALEAATGKRVWGFQVVHHDLWDYDVAAEPLLFTFRNTIPAVAITTKQGLIFVLNRLTGEPLYPVVERPVPASDVPGEQASPTQPFQQIPSLSPTSIDPHAFLGNTPQDNVDCHKIFHSLRYDGIYTPPSEQGSLVFPGNLGGVNWGGASIDPATGVLYANTNRYAFSVKFFRRNPTLLDRVHEHFLGPRLLPAAFALIAVVLILLAGTIRRKSLFPGWVSLVFTVIVLLAARVYLHRLDAAVPGRPSHSTEHFGFEAGTQTGTPYTVVRQQITAPADHLPCTAMPWGTVSAVNLNTAQPVFQVPLGTKVADEHTGTLNLGGDVVTASGLVFTAASEQPMLRAFDSTTGAELWDGALPVPAQATPMSYTVNGRQYVAIAAGGHGLFGTEIGDSLVAFALPQSAKH